MSISNGVDSTIIYDINIISKEKQVTTIAQLIQLFKIEGYFPLELLPSTDCFNEISTINPNSIVAETICNFGISFNIFNTSHTEETSINKSDHLFLIMNNFL